MLNIFYQNKTLNDTLIISTSNAKPTNIDEKGDVIIGSTGTFLCFINIINARKHFASYPLHNGMLYPTNELISLIKQLSGIDLTSHLDNGFVVGMIDECQDIQGTHLHKCIVDIGSKKLHIICGAPNAKKGLKVVVATSGTMLPSGKAIMAGELLGNKSEGMLCSYRELNILKESHGIIELDDSYKLGEIFKEAYANCR